MLSKPTRWLKLHLSEQTIARQVQKDKQRKQSDKTGNWRKKQRCSPYKRTQPIQQQPKQPSKQQPARPCKHCGGNHYDNQCNKVQVNAIAVPLLEPLLEGTAIASQQVLYPKPSKMLARLAALIKTDVRQQSIRAQACRHVAACGANAEQLQYLMVCCNAVVDSPTVKALRVQHNTLTEKDINTVLKGVFYACAATLQSC
jgi:hypothetical protein